MRSPQADKIIRLEVIYSFKVGYHIEFRCQHQPASFSLAFKLSGTACLVGWGWGVGGSLLRLGTL